jgi:hypothetical protein
LLLDATISGRRSSASVHKCGNGCADRRRLRRRRRRHRSVASNSRFSRKLKKLCDCVARILGLAQPLFDGQQLGLRAQYLVFRDLAVVEQRFD